MYVINLDPAAEYFDYPVIAGKSSQHGYMPMTAKLHKSNPINNIRFNSILNIDIRELIQVDDVMDDPDLHLGPNGGLVFCMEYVFKSI